MDGELNKMEDNTPKRDESGKLLPGTPPLNPAGRPKGKTLKEFAREYLMNLPDDEKQAYLRNLPQDIVWRMAEGNPHQSSEVAGEITVARPLLEMLKGRTEPKEIEEAAGTV